MSLYLVEMKIKTALELVDAIQEQVDDIDLPIHESVTGKAIRRNFIGLRGVLREIINRPKEEGNNG